MTHNNRVDLSTAASDTLADMATEAISCLEQIQVHQNLYRKSVS